MINVAGSFQSSEESIPLRGRCFKDLIFSKAQGSGPGWPNLALNSTNTIQKSNYPHIYYLDFQ